jgi:glycosyltransferase involved in cell wall biosynthesis
VVVANDFAHVNGGAAQVAISSAAGLASRGHKVIFFAAVPPVAPELQVPNLLVELTGQADIKTDPNRLRAATQGIWNWRAASQLRARLQPLDPQRTIVHVHGWMKALTSSVVHAALQARIPVVITLHDYFYACPNGGFYNFQKESACPLRALSGACLATNCDRDGYPQKLWRSARQVIQNHFGLVPDPLLSFVTLSDFSEHILKDYLPESATTYRIANPADAVRTDPVDVSNNRGFVAVGRLSPEKGYAILARAARQTNCPVTFVGEGPSRHEILAANPDAQITGWLDRGLVKARLRAARALIFPSVWYEAQPLVIGEAAELGVPAIVSDGCAGKEQIKDGMTGLLFRSGDVNDLSEKLKLMRDAEFAFTLGRAAYDGYWRNPPTLDAHLDRLEECYLSVLERNSRELTVR